MQLNDHFGLILKVNIWDRFWEIFKSFVVYKKDPMPQNREQIRKGSAQWVIYVGFPSPNLSTILFLFFFSQEISTEPVSKIHGAKALLRS